MIKQQWEKLLKIIIKAAHIGINALFAQTEEVPRDPPIEQIAKALERLELIHTQQQGGNQEGHTLYISYAWLVERIAQQNALHACVHGSAVMEERQRRECSRQIPLYERDGGQQLGKFLRNLFLELLGLWGQRAELMGEFTRSIAITPQAIRAVLLQGHGHHRRGRAADDQ